MEVPLTQGQHALIDEEDAQMVMQYRWSVRRGRHTWYAVSYRGRGRHARPVFMHRLLMGLEGRRARSVEVDHVDGNGLNNTRANLRLATRAQNARNHRRSAANTSGYMGVSWHAGSRTWCVQIRAQGRALRVGLYRDLDDAARAYNEAARRYYGPFARLNDVPPAPSRRLLPAPAQRLLLAPPLPWQGVGAEQAEARATRLGHDLRPAALVGGVLARQCSRCLALALARRDGSYGGSALEQGCATRTGGRARRERRTSGAAPDRQTNSASATMMGSNAALPEEA